MSWDSICPGITIKNDGQVWWEEFEEKVQQSPQKKYEDNARQFPFESRSSHH